MELIKAEIIKRGNSLGFVIPKEATKREGIKPGDLVQFRIVKRHN